MADAPAICSARGCRATAEYTLVWNNPKIHEPNREKTWLACADHRDSLGEFLRIRGFLRRIDPFTAPADAPAATGADPRADTGADPRADPRADPPASPPTGTAGSRD